MHKRKSSRLSLKEGAKDFQEYFALTTPNTFFIDGTKIPLMLFKPRNIANPVTIIYSHHSSESFAIIRDWLSLLSAVLKATIIAWEYPGYCEENPKFTTAAVKRNVKKKIVLYGKGAGCGVALYLAYKHMLLTKKVTQNNTLAGLFLVDPVVDYEFDGKEFINEKRLKKITSPTVFIVRDNVEPTIRDMYSLLQTQSGFFEMAPDKNFEIVHMDEIIGCLASLFRIVFPNDKETFNINVINEKIRTKPKNYSSPLETLQKHLSTANLHHLAEKLIGFGYTSPEELQLLTKHDISSITTDEMEQEKLLEIAQQRHKDITIAETEKINKVPPVVVTSPQQNSRQNQSITSPRAVLPPISISKRRHMSNRESTYLRGEKPHTNFLITSGDVGKKKDENPGTF
ncbi:Serine aminopeptidase S33 domain-containing protein [Entamoeba marina]